MRAAINFKKLCLSFIFVCFSLVLFKPFIANQLRVRGDGYLTYNMHNDAIRQYKKALLLSPRNSKIMNWLAFAYKTMGNKNKAIDTYKKAIKIDPQNTEAYHDLGMIYMSDKKYKLAKEYFLKAASVADKENFYYRMSLKMLANCRKKLNEIENTSGGNRYEK